MICLFVYGYLMSASYRLWFLTFITLISGIILKCGFYTMLLLLVSFIFVALRRRILGFGDIVLRCFVLFYYTAGLIALAGLGYYYGLGHDSNNLYFSCYVRFRRYVNLFLCHMILVFMVMFDFDVIGF